MMTAGFRATLFAAPHTTPSAVMAGLDPATQTRLPRTRIARLGPRVFARG